MNIKPQELRIGNWIKSIAGNETVIDVMCDSINTRALEAIQDEYIEPIPLTEEWLLKFGFEKNTWYGDDDETPIEGYDFDDYFWLDKNLVLFNYSATLVKIEYVHQLQNLFFALTGEELQINQPQKS